MTIEKKMPSMHICDLARLMTTDTSCLHSVWFLSRYSNSLRTVANVHDQRQQGAGGRVEYQANAWAQHGDQEGGSEDRHVQDDSQCQHAARIPE